VKAPAAQDIAVGGGLAGLAAAWLLGRGHRVTLYERQPRPGFTAASVEFGAGPERIDVPLRVFYPGYYPTLTRLYAELGVESEPVSYAASFTDADGALYFRYRNLRAGNLSFGYLAPPDWLLGPRAWRIVQGLLAFNGRSLPALAGGALAGRTIGEWTADDRPEFVEGFLLPVISTVATCTTEAAREFPAETIVDYLARGVARQSVRRALHGADGVEQKLRRGIPKLRCAAPVVGVQRRERGIVLHLADGSEHRHDHAVLATQASDSRRLLDDANPAERRMLGAIRYQPVEVLTHTDPALMPARRRDWSPVNLRVDASQAAPEATIWVNAVQPGLGRAEPVFQTVHPARAPAAVHLIGHAHFERPLVGSGTAAALRSLQKLHAEADRRIWFCGSWAQPGIPLLESAVASAQAVAQRFGQGLRAENSA
jgi:uncharacterized protein